MPRLRSRIAVALAIGVASGLLSYALLANRGYLASDFTWPMRAASAFLSGHDPYVTIRATGPYPFDAPFYYPLTAAFVAVPFANLPPYLAGSLFFAVSSGLLAIVALRDSWQRLPLFLSAPFVVAASVAQWSPLLLAAALSPLATWLLTCKPNLGVSLAAYRPTKSGLLVAVTISAVSVLVLPSWPLSWLRNVLLAGRYHSPALLLPPYTLVLLLALFRWRTPEGRLLTMMSLVPQLLWFYDQLPLWLIPRSWRTSVALSVSSWVAYLSWSRVGAGLSMGSAVSLAAPFVLLLIYLPALLIALAKR